MPGPGLPNAFYTARPPGADLIRPKLVDFLEAFVLKDALDLLFERGQVLVDHVPGHLQVDAEILVDKYVAGARDVAPRDGRILGPEVLGDPLRRLTNDLQGDE